VEGRQTAWDGSSCHRGSAFPFVPLVHPLKNREVDWNLTSAGMTGHARRFVHRHRSPNQLLRARSRARGCRAACSLIGPPEDVLSPNSGFRFRFLVAGELRNLVDRRQVHQVSQWFDGHQNLATTQRYMHLSAAGLDAAIRLLDGPKPTMALEKSWRRREIGPELPIS
jgi:hypothetical protein